MIRETHTTQSDTLFDISDFDREDLACAGLRRAWPPDLFGDDRPSLAEAIAKTAPPRRRKPSIADLIERAERAGKHVTSIVTADGTTINFDEPKPTDASNPWLVAIEKAAKP